jgi:uncharacterized membrane protein YphA (DoxX/SURF4 family)
MEMDYLFIFGRILYGGFFVINGVNHLVKSGMLANYAASKKVPAPKLAVVVSGLIILLGGLGVLLGVYVTWSLVLISVFLLIVTFAMHNYWKVTDPSQRMPEMINFMKNMALLGATLMLLFLPTPWSWSLGR